MIDIAAVSTNNFDASIHNDVDYYNTADNLNLESIVDTSSANNADFQAFQAAVSNGMQQNIAPSALVHENANLASVMIDTIAEERKKISYLTQNIDKLSAVQAAELQEATEKFSLTTQLLSKSVLITTKAVDSIIHMQ